jgi:hypothetical protein
MALDGQRPNLGSRPTRFEALPECPRRRVLAGALFGLAGSGPAADGWSGGVVRGMVVGGGRLVPRLSD